MFMSGRSLVESVCAGHPLRTRKIVVLALAVFVLLTACGSADHADSVASESATSVAPFPTVPTSVASETGQSIVSEPPRAETAPIASTPATSAPPESTPTAPAPDQSAPVETTKEPPANHLQASTAGAWSELAGWPFIPIHVGILPDGRMISYGSTPTGAQGGQLQYDIWDPADGLGAAAHLTLPNSTAVDTFCSAGLLMPQSGNFLTASGDARGRADGYTTNRNKDVLAFDYRTNNVSKLQRTLNHQRWYGTMTMLPSGEVLMQAGMCRDGDSSLCDNGVVYATTPEIYRPATGWQLLTGAQSETYYGEAGTKWWYPRSWVAPDGRIFGISGGNDMYYLETGGQGLIQSAGSISGAYHGNSASAVMYRPGKILLVGGGSEANYDINPNGTDTARIIDLNSGSPLVALTSPLNTGRQWHNATVLADGQVLVTGGSIENNAGNGATPEAALWNPDSGLWRYGASATQTRLYHSAAVLLPDGRVWTGGGGAPGPFTNLNAEIYSPPYLFDTLNQPAARPVMVAAPQTIAWDDDTFDVSLAYSGPISKVSFIASGAVTHSFDMNQRYLELAFTQTGTTLRIAKPASANLAPPGFYLLFVFNDQGVPSVAKIVRVVNGNVDASPDVKDGGQSEGLPGSLPG